MMSATVCCSADMLSKEMSWDASVTPAIRPVSCSGTKPLGIAVYSQMLAKKVSIGNHQHQALVTECPAQPVLV